jgi:hypothetical protein
MATTQPKLQEWLQLIRAEFDELPDLRLTHAEVEERWAIDATIAEALLSALVSVGFLRRSDQGMYMRVKRRRWVNGIQT